jgi:hypothetical protein
MTLKDRVALAARSTSCHGMTRMTRAHIAATVPYLYWEGAQTVGAAQLTVHVGWTVQ